MCDLCDNCVFSLVVLEPMFFKPICCAIQTVRSAFQSLQAVGDGLHMDT